jgi:hypothetical protein
VKRDLKDVLVLVVVWTGKDAMERKLELEWRVG